MRIRQIGSILSAAAALLLLPAIFAQSADRSKTAAGVPDISGVWLIDHFQAGLFPNGNAPFTPWGEARFKAADPKVNDPNLGCLPHGMPRVMFVPLPIQIFQVPGMVLMLQEAGNQVRQIHLNRQHPKEFDTLTYNGDSVGKWDGDTLVVDTIGMNDITWLDHIGSPHSEALHVIERIHRVDHDTLQDDFTIEDPKAYTVPFKASQTYKLQPGWEIAEFACEKNHYTYHPPK